MAPSIPGRRRPRARSRRRVGTLAYYQRRGLSRGLLDGRRGWLYLGVGIWGMRKLRMIARGGPPEILISEALKPGERIIIAAGRATLDGSGTSQAQSQG